MEIRKGKALLDQIAFGRLRFFSRSKTELPQVSLCSQEEEWLRFAQARRLAVLELAGLYDKAFEQVGAEVAAVFAIHAMLLEDEDLEDSVRTLIFDKNATAEYAVRLTGEGFYTTFAELDDPYMKARAADIRDLSRRVIRILLGQEREDPFGGESAILVADEFLPSEVMELDRRYLLGLVSRRGSIDSHAAILLRAYHIPVITQVELDPCWDGHLALLDGFDGCLYLDPEEGLTDKLRERYQRGAGRKTEIGAITP